MTKYGSLEERQRDVARRAGAVFYDEGIHPTGVARIAAQLRMSKKTLYELFPSKETLIAAGLADRDIEVFTAWTTTAEQSSTDPAEQLIALVRLVSHAASGQEFRGCPFLLGAAAFPDPANPVHLAATAHKARLRRWIAATARRADLRHSARLANQLELLIDGTLAHATVGRTDIRVVVEAAQHLIDAHRSCRHDTAAC